MKRTRINVQGATLPRMDRTDIWVGGYHTPMASTFVAELDITDENNAVYGYDSLIETRVLNAGTLTLSSFEHPNKTAELIDVLMSYDPAMKGLRGYKARGSFVTDVVRLTKHPLNDYYVTAEFFPAWNVVLKPKTGDPKAAGVRQLDGKCALPLEFRVTDPETQTVAIVFDTAAMTLDSSGAFTSGTLASQTTLIANPTTFSGPLAGQVGLAVEIQHRNAPDSNNPNGVIQKAARLSVVTGMVTTAGVVKVYAADLTGTNFTLLSDITHVHVYALNTPVVSGSAQLLGDGLDVRGRFDLPT